MISSVRRFVAYAVLIGLSLVWTVSIWAQTDPLELLEREDPIYPQLARLARLEGDVEVRFRVDDTGRTFDVTVVSGHPVLVGTAEEAVNGWRFSPRAHRLTTPEIQRTVFRFSVGAPPEATPYGTSAAYIGLEFDGPEWSRVLVTGNCRIPNGGAVIRPSLEAASPEDYVELHRSDPSYRVRMYRTGIVEWEGFFSVKTETTVSSTVDPSTASELLDDLSANPFWSMCASYSAAVFDSSTYHLEAVIGGVHKSVKDYARSGPTVLHEMMDRVDIVTDTHHWRHGEPSSEPLSNIILEWFSKPGMTDLMRAAGDGGENRVPEALTAGVDIHAVDASGWTALMYAAANHYDHGERIDQLLAAGADPTHRDSQGYTPLMAGAMGARRFRSELVDAGVDVNDQSDSGITALMILATRAGTEEIHLAIEAGADPTLRDSEGRTAIDYLIAADCHRSPFWDPVDRFIVVGNPGCGALDRKDYRTSLKLLRQAVKRTNRERSRHH